MSVEQAKAFVDGLQQLSDSFREDSRTTTEDYAKDMEGVAEEFQEYSHTYAKDMVELADKYVEDIQKLYQSIYPESKS